MSFRHLQTSIERTKQKRKALHMLALSGVIRPSHVELRYTFPISMGEDATDALPNTPAAPVRPWSFVQKVFELMIRLIKDNRSLALHLPNCKLPKLRKASPTDILPSS